MDGKQLEGSDVKLSCKSSDGSDPIYYKWERVLDKGKSLGKLPNLALIGKEAILMLSGHIQMLSGCDKDPTSMFPTTFSEFNSFSRGSFNCSTEDKTLNVLRPFWDYIWRESCFVFNFIYIFILIFIMQLWATLLAPYSSRFQWRWFWHSFWITKKEIFPLIVAEVVWITCLEPCGSSLYCLSVSLHPRLCVATWKPSN